MPRPFKKSGRCDIESVKFVWVNHRSPHSVVPAGTSRPVVTRQDGPQAVPQNQARTDSGSGRSTASGMRTRRTLDPG